MALSARVESGQPKGRRRSRALRSLQGAGMLGFGLLTGWLARSPRAELAGAAVLLAVMNGYSKAYSP